MLPSKPPSFPDIASVQPQRLIILIPDHLAVTTLKTTGHKRLFLQRYTVRWNSASTNANGGGGPVLLGEVGREAGLDAT